MKSGILILLTFGLMVSCSSGKKEEKLKKVKHEELQKDYVVRDSSSNARPEWVEDAELWANQYNKDMEAFRYFAFETEPKVSREIACNLAKANARADIAAEVTTFIDKTLGASQSGQASIDENNPHVRAMREYVENTLAEKVQALIHGAAVVKTYWEKRQYQKARGAVRDFTAYTCAVFVRMPTDRLQAAINEAANHVAGAVDDPDTKENVKRALANASEDYVKAKKGEL